MRSSYLLLLCAPLMACDSPPANAKEPSSPPADGAAGVGKKAEPTPQIIQKAEEILRSNEDAPYGKEIPFQLNGKRFVARVEEHDNATREAGRPQGKHKGITVYER